MLKNNMDDHYEEINLFVVCVLKRIGFGITMVDLA